MLAAAVVAGTWVILSHLYSRALADRERELQNIALVIAEQTDRAFQSLDLIQINLIERMHTLGIRSNEDYERHMSGHDVHVTLKEKISGLPHVQSVALFNSDGNLINSSRFWPIRPLNVADGDQFKALKSDAQPTSVVSAPVHNRITGNWTVYLERKITGPNGEFLGVVSGGLDLEYFERFLASIALGNESVISLFRRDGLKLVGYPWRDGPGRSYAEGALFKNVLAHADYGVVRRNGLYDGNERLIAGHSLAHYPVVVAVGTTIAAALAEWRGAASYMVGAALLLMLVIGVTVLLSIRQVKNYEHLVKARANHDQKQRLDTALNNMRQGLLLFDSESRLVLHNERYLQMYGLSSETTKPGCMLRDLLLQRKATGTFNGDPDQYIAKLVNSGRVETKEVDLPDGRTISVTNAQMADGGWVSTHDDITERRRAEAERDRNRELLDLIIENVPETIFVKDASDRRFVLVNRACEADWGLPRSGIIGKTAYDIFPKGAADVINERDERLLQCPDPLYFDEHSIRMPRNGERIVTSKRFIIRDDDGKQRYLVGVVEDITDRKRAEERIERLAHYDSVTDLPNRVLFCEQLEQALTCAWNGEGAAMLYIDLDHFKRINDTLGHPIGDELLKRVAERLRSCVREIDLIARLSGDEFVIVQTSLTQPLDAADLATRIREVLKAPYDLNGHQVVVDVSIGIAIAPNDGTERDQLLKNADMALYEAKTSGRGTYRFYEPEMDQRMKARAKLELDLRKALVGGEFELFYQPLVNLEDNEISAFEALLRWHHPERGMILPAEFIPVAEEIGLITPLGEWILRTACAEAATWPDNIKVAVNLSPAQLIGNNLIPVVISALAASGLPARRLEFEITESVFMQNTFVTLDTLHQLRKFGVRIAMDDFGTGHSSLSYLLSFPFDKIKIDRCFIKGLPDDENSHAIVRAVANLASSLNMMTIAEGVETQQQLEVVKALGCTEMQGYLFSPPRPAREIPRLFLSRADRTASAA